MPQYPLGGVEDAPATWTLPSSLQLDVEAIYAVFDGTLAAGSFIPTVEIVSDAGLTVLEVPQDSTVSAGSSVKASWASFLRNLTGGGGGSSLTVTDGITSVSSVTTIDFTSGATVTSGGAGIADVAVTGGGGYTPQNSEEYVNTASLSVGSNSTGTLACARAAGGTFLDFTTATQPKFLTNGVFAITVTWQTQTNAASLNRYQAALTITQAALGVQTFAQDVYSPTNSDVLQAVISWTGQVAANDSFNIKVLNLDTIARNFQTVAVAVQRILIP